MRVETHRLFEVLLDAADADIESSISYSLATSPPLSEFLDELDPGLLLDWSGRSFQGDPLLRQRIVAAAALGPSCGPDDVVVTAGAAEANFLALATLLRPGDEVVVEQPGWPQPVVLAPALGARVVSVARREDEGWRLDVDELLAAIGPRTRVVFVSSPSVPTGQVFDDGALGAVAERVERFGGRLLVDEVYAGLEWDTARARAAATLTEHTITTGSVSKALGLQGLRIGWLATRDASLIRDAVVLRESTSEIMNVLGEAVATIALREDRLGVTLARVREQGTAALELVDEAVTSCPGLSWCRPRASLVGLARLEPPHDADGVAARLLAPPHRTLVIPGSAYGLPHHLRLGVGGGDEARLDVGLKRLAAVLGSATG